MFVTISTAFVTSTFVLMLVLPAKHLRHDAICLYTDHTVDLECLVEDLIQRSKRSIWIETFNMSNKSIINLVNRKRKLGFQVQTNVHKPGSSTIMHRKTIVTDNEMVLIPSLNLSTKKSLSKQHNNILFILDRDIASFITNTSKTFMQKMLLNHEFKIWKTPPHTEPFDAIIHDIKNAKRSINIAMFRLSDKKIIHELIQAHCRGVNVNVMLDEMSDKRSRQSLIESGINVFINHNKMIHHKMAIFDFNTIWLGSANWSFRGLHKNIEILLRTYSRTSSKLNASANQAIRQLKHNK